MLTRNSVRPLILSLPQKCKRTLYSSSHLNVNLRFRHLLFFTIYSLSVCPSDNSLESLIFRGLSIYHKLVLDPFVLPPLNSTYRTLITHPSVAPKIEQAIPVVDKVMLVADRVLERVTPVARGGRILHDWNRHLHPISTPSIQKYTARRVLPSRTTTTSHNPTYTPQRSKRTNTPSRAIVSCVSRTLRARRW